jgi:GT2 family glycosyltransferase
MEDKGGADCIIGVVIVTYNSASVIEDCLQSLHRSKGADLKVIVVDNASADETCEVVRRWGRTGQQFIELPSASESASVLTAAHLILVRSPVNAGFAGGVNTGLRLLQQVPDLSLFWVLNPDIRVCPDAAANYARRAAEVRTFGLMGGRTLYVHPNGAIQSDGGKLNSWTGMCANLNLGRKASDTPYPTAEKFDYITGANVVASRVFLEVVGLMEEHYFLYYEEVDWAFRRGTLELVYAPEAVVEHHGGSAIGSPVLGKTQGTAFSNYFNYRSRMRFMRRFFPARVPIAYAYSALKILRLFMQGFFDEAHGAFRGLHALPPPASLRRRLTDEAARFAFGD